jgi:hypothetical protein
MTGYGTYGFVHAGESVGGTSALETAYPRKTPISETQVIPTMMPLVFASLRG